MTKRTRAAVAMSAALLAIGSVLAHFGMKIGLIIKLPVMLFRIVVAIALPGTAAGNWWQSALAYLLAGALYALVFGFILKRIGAYKTLAEQQRDASAAKGTSVFVKLAGYAATAALVFVIAQLQGKQEEEFTEKSRLAAIEHCNQDSACLKNVDEHFGACFEANHESHKSGKFNRRHSLDESGFNNCLASFQAPAEPDQDAEEMASATTAASVEGVSMPAVVAATADAAQVSH